jgi:hypothetical protein
VQGLRLLETFSLPEVEAASGDALQWGTLSFDAIKHLRLCRIKRRPPRLDLENYPHLPLAEVHTTQAADYLTLLSAPMVSSEASSGEGMSSRGHTLHFRPGTYFTVLTRG